MKFGKNEKKSFLSYNNCFISNFIQPRLYVCRAPWKKLCSFTCLIKLWVWKKKFLFCKRSGKRFQFWIQKLCEPWTVKHCNLYEWDYLCLNYVKLAEVMQEANVSKIPWPIVIKMLQNVKLLLLDVEFIFEIWLIVPVKCRLSWSSNFLMA